MHYKWIGMAPEIAMAWKTSVVPPHDEAPARLFLPDEAGDFSARSSFFARWRFPDSRRCGKCLVSLFPFQGKEAPEGAEEERFALEKTRSG